MFLGLRTVIYPAADLGATREWFATVLGVQPYFDEPFYVGDGIKVGSVVIPSGSVLGVIENPHFTLLASAPAASAPGR